MRHQPTPPPPPTPTTHLNADTILGENFALDDIAAGYYEVIVDVGSKKYKEEVWVYPRRTSFVEIVLEN